MRGRGQSIVSSLFLERKLKSLGFSSLPLFIEAGLFVIGVLGRPTANDGSDAPLDLPGSAIDDVEAG